MSKIIMGVRLPERINNATQFQSILSKYGCTITTRLGLHIATPKLCSQEGLIILEFVDDADEAAFNFEKELQGLEGVKIQKMIF